MKLLELIAKVLNVLERGIDVIESVLNLSNKNTSSTKSENANSSE